MGADDDALTLATQETLVKNLVYITNIQEGKLDTMKNAKDNSKNPSKQKSDSIHSNDKLKDYRESGIDRNPRRDKEWKKKIKNMKKLYIWNLI